MTKDNSRQDPLVSDETRHLLGGGDNVGMNHGPAHERWPQHKWPREIGNNVIVGKLGEGGAAIVFDAINKENGHKRALKVLFPDCSTDDRRRFDREIALSSQLQHCNTIGALEHGEWEHLPFLAMKKIEGRTLSKLIKTNEKLPATVVAFIGRSAAGTLSYCHSLRYKLDGQQHTGIVHRDIKPTNMLVGNDGELYITDFSIATPVLLEGRDDNPYGSVPYFAPEILENRTADQRSDIFSLGCTLYEALTGVRAFDADDIDALMQKRKKHLFEDLKTLASDAPPRLIDLIKKCMSYDPDQRPQSMTEVERQLSDILNKMAGKKSDTILEDFIKGNTLTRSSSSSFGKIMVGFIIVSIAAVVLGIGYSPVRNRITEFLPWEFNDLDISFETSRFFGSSSEDNERMVPDSPATVEEEKRQNNSSGQVNARPPRKHITFSPRRRNSPAKKNRSESGVEPAAAKRSPPPESASFSVRGNAASRNSAPVEGESGPDQAVHTDVQASADQNKQEPTLTQQLMQQHGTYDMLEVLKKEAAAHHYENVLIILDEFPEKQRQSPLAQIHRLRAMDATGRLTEAYLREIDADDAEIHMIRAKLYYKKGDYEQAIDYIRKARRSPVMLLNRSRIEKQASLLEARTRSTLFRNSPNETTRKAAMESWIRVKSAFRDERSSPMIAEANQSIRELINAEEKMSTVEQ